VRGAPSQHAPEEVALLAECLMPGHAADAAHAWVAAQVGGQTGGATLLQTCKQGRQGRQQGSTEVVEQAGRQVPEGGGWLGCSVFA
jgi:hypothetical protein